MNPSYEELEQRVRELESERDRSEEQVRDYSASNHSYYLHIEQLEDENEQLTVQLVGCSVAALGGTKDPAKKGDWGWSPSYQDVLDMRLRLDTAEGLLEEAKKISRIEGYHDWLTAYRAFKEGKEQK